MTDRNDIVERMHLLVAWNMKKILPLFLCACLFLASEGRDVRSKFPSKENIIKIIKSSDGDVFECVDIYKQPAFDHPLLKDHKLQMKPSSEPKGPPDTVLPENLFPQFNEGCPEGNVPIQRLERNGLTSANYSLGIRAPFQSAEASPNGFKDFTAGTLTRIFDTGWYGGGAAFNVYGIPQVGQNQLSYSGLWIVNTNSAVLLTAGWLVDPSVYKDTNTKLSIVWNAYGGIAKCYNLQCPGFVQINKNIYLGSNIRPLSTHMGEQYYITVYIYKDLPTGNWWFSFGNPANYVGYWPKDIFPKGLEVAEQMLYGGYVTCPESERCPPMGNGDLPSRGTACYVKKVSFVDKDTKIWGLLEQLRDPDSNNPSCYDVGSYNRVGINTFEFTYGGPGCP